MMPEAAIARARGFVRSLAIYHGRPGARRRLARLLAPLIRPGDLCFDVGAHLGNRALAMLSLGARVVAVEPQPEFRAFLDWLARRNPGLIVEPLALGAAAGEAVLLASSATPTVSSLSADWARRMAGEAGFSAVRWDRRVPVRVATLDDLVARHGMPAFVKIDVEGGEGAVLAGLGAAVPALCFEFLPAARDLAFACLDRVEALGDYRFNVALGENDRFEFSDWVGGDAIRDWLGARPPRGRSGDLYARLRHPEAAR